MIKFAITTAALLAFAAPAFAMDMRCDEASITKMETDAGVMKDATKRDAVMKDMKMARASMKEYKAADCEMHMQDASKSMMQ